MSILKEMGLRGLASELTEELDGKAPAKKPGLAQ